ncbi:MAG: hypothetical protein DRR16_02570 [Candidatus Parabeggiatoa sp. nov. 3]|nr:MAG: hypothetical protein DRR00_32500 [Gammaproteobacteria bacterium]RKZ63578.1 MAG: hypothetical protein DRQ99_16885 [Gammaproteobacteria bacterium]RKZ89372.1 MAG: hypothetical protein DRR16_02570 [Gammaproteobacteria bacterium]
MALALGTLTGFFIGKNTQNTQEIQKFAVLLNAFQSHLQQLEIKLTKDFEEKTHQNTEALESVTALHKRFQRDFQQFASNLVILFAGETHKTTQAIDQIETLLKTFQSQNQDFESKLLNRLAKENHQQTQAFDKLTSLINTLPKAIQPLQREMIHVLKSEGHQNSEAINKVAVLINTFQNRFQHLEQELAQKMGIAISAGTKQPDLTTDQALLKAEALLKQGDLTRAGLYFSHSLNQNPGQWKKIQRYQQHVLNYCRQSRDNGEYEIALNVLAQMETFLRTQIGHIKQPDIEKLAQALTEIAEFRQVTTSAMAAKKLVETRHLMKTLLVDDLGSPSTTEPQKLTQHINSLKTKLTALQSLDTSLINKNGLAQIKQKIALLENSIPTFETQLATAQSSATVSTLVQRAEQFIKKSKNEPPQSELILYYLSSAESIIRQLVLLAPETTPFEMMRLSQKLELAKQEIAQRQSQLVFKKIQQAFNQLQFAPKTNAQVAIDKLITFKTSLSQQATQLSAMRFIEQAQTLMETVNSQIKDWQEKQRQRYEQWAVKNILDFYSSHKDELGVGTDEQRIYAGIIEHMGNIDTRYLSTSASTAYHEVFNLFYAELSHHLKIPLSSDMTFTLKKALSDF